MKQSAFSCEITLSLLTLIGNKHASLKECLFLSSSIQPRIILSKNCIYSNRSGLFRTELIQFKIELDLLLLNQDVSISRSSNAPVND